MSVCVSVSVSVCVNSQEPLVMLWTVGNACTVNAKGDRYNTFSHIHSIHATKQYSLAHLSHSRMR